MNKTLIFLLFCLLTNSIFSQDIVLKATPKDSLDSSWTLTGKTMIVKDRIPYIRVDTQGNCRWEWRQVCTSLPSGGVNCKLEPEWTCDYRSGLFTLPAEVKVVDNEVRYVKDATSIKLGKMKNFLFWKWVSLENYVGIFTDIATARLIIRDAEEVNREIRFNQLHK